MMMKELNTNLIDEAGGIISEVRRRHRKGITNVIHVIGLPGTGKSWACIRLGEIITQDLHGENRMFASRICDNLLDILKAIRNVRRRGEVIIIEEASVLFDVRRAMAADNVDAGKIFDTFRKKGIIVIMNNPVSRDLDSKLGRLSTMSVQTLALNKRKGICILKPLKLQTNPSSGKTYRHRLKDGNGYDVHRCWIGKPSQETTQEYEQMKDKFLNDLYDVLIAKQEKKKEKVLKELDMKIVGMKDLPTITATEKRRAGYRDKGMQLLAIAKIEGVSDRAVSKSISDYKKKMEKIEKYMFAQRSCANGHESNRQEVEEKKP